VFVYAAYRMLYRWGVYALRRRDQPACWTRRAINMFVSDVNKVPNRTGLPGIASLESIVGALLTFGLVEP